MRIGLAVGGLGVVLLIVSFLLEGYAASGDQVLPGGRVELTGTSSSHLVGIVEPGRDAREPVTCTAVSVAGTEVVEIGTRQEAFEAIRAGRRVRALGGEPTTVVCDRSVMVTSGWVVRAYPLAGSAVLYPIYAVVAILGFSYARRRGRAPATVGSPVLPGDDGNRWELKRLAVETLLSAVGVMAMCAAIALGVVGVLVLQEGSRAGLVSLIIAGSLAVVAGVAGRWRRACRRHGGPNRAG